MCGIFGYVGKPLSGKAMDRLWFTAVDTEYARGGHAYGWVWIDEDGDTNSFKSPGQLADSDQAFEMLRGAVAVVGHCRYATHGTYEDNANNHPHPSDGGYLVHNGVIRNYREISAYHGLNLVSQCDSEVLARMVEKFQGHSYSKRLAMAMEPVQGACAVAGIWKDKVYLGRKGNPLHHSTVGSALYFASLGEHLPGRAASYPDWHVTTVKAKSAQATHGRKISGAVPWERCIPGRLY